MCYLIFTASNLNAKNKPETVRLTSLITEVLYKLKETYSVEKTSVGVCCFQSSSQVFLSRLTLDLRVFCECACLAPTSDISSAVFLCGSVPRHLISFIYSTHFSHYYTAQNGSSGQNNSRMCLPACQKAAFN